VLLPALTRGADHGELVATSRTPAPIAATGNSPSPRGGKPQAAQPGTFAIQQVQGTGQFSGGIARPSDDAAAMYQIPIEPPGRDRLFRLESEEALKERMRQEALSRTPRERIVFPQEPILSRETYTGRHWPVLSMVVEPNYLCYNRLLFEQKNFERYGWDLGPVTTAISPLLFYGDMVASPYKLLRDPCRHHECNSGYCLPGDPVPLLLYPPVLTSGSGWLAEAAVIAVLLVAFP
jgi:hypothetical protein